MRTNKNLKYALVLSGGGARGLVHVGVLCALEEAGYPRPSLIAGTSMGAIIGGLYASGMDGKALKRQVLEELDVSRFMESHVFKLDGPIGKLFQTGQMISHIATKPGIDSGNKVLALLKELSRDKQIEDCEIPFLCNAADLCSGREVIFRQGSLARAIRASMSFPVVFEPLTEGDLCLVDGGVADNMPVRAAWEAAKDMGIKRILAVDTRRWRNLSAPAFKTGVNTALRCFEVQVRIAENAAASLGVKGPPLLVLHAADKSSAFDFSRKRELIKLGEAAVHESSGPLAAFFGLGPGAALERMSLKDCGIESDTYYTADAPG